MFPDTKCGSILRKGLIPVVNEVGYWYEFDGKIHRDDDCPAVVYHGVEWWKNGHRHRKTTGSAGRTLPAVHRNGTSEWWVNGKLHREDRDEDGYTLPAVISEGYQAWYQHGLMHRSSSSDETKGNLRLEGDLPALVLSNGRQEWWKEGKRHRLNGPAVSYPDGRGEWWREGVMHRDETDKHGTSLPAVITSVTRKWIKNGKLDRNDGPAVILSEHGRYRCEEWWVDGKRHRIEGPAVIDTAGVTEWWNYGKKL